MLKYFFHCLNAILLVLPSVALCSTKFEAYSVRPVILSVQPIEHSLALLPAGWQRIRNSLMHAAVFILETYPVQDIYFLGRDSELIYDAAKLIASRDSYLANRNLYLVNISTPSSSARGLRSYLSRFELNSEAIRGVQQKLVVDVGLHGSIFSRILQFFPNDLHGKILFQLIESVVPKYRGIASSGLNALSMEGLTHHTARATAYGLRNGVWEAVSPTDRATLVRDKVDQDQALRMQESLAYFISKESDGCEYRRNQLRWRSLRQLIETGAHAELHKKLNELSQDERADFLFAVRIQASSNCETCSRILEEREGFRLRKLRE